MAHEAASREKVTLSLPRELVRYADERARALAANRSQVVAAALVEMRQRELDDLAREGYAVYAEESAAFAAESSTAFSEVLHHAG